jgi:hypothetical protein
MTLPKQWGAMAMNVDCQTWEAFTMALKQVRSIKAFPQIDEVEAKMAKLAKEIMADTRRSNAVSLDCPKKFADIQARAGSTGQAPAPISLATLPAQLSSLDDKVFQAVEAAVIAERTRRA